MSGDQARGIEQSAVAADGDDEIGASGERLFGAQRDAAGREREADAGIDQGAQPTGKKMAGQA